MKTNRLTVPIAALVIALGSFPAEAQRGERQNRGNQGQGQQRSRSEASGRSGNRQDRNQDRPRADASVQPRGGQAPGGGGNGGARGRESGSAAVRGGQRGSSQDYGRNGSSAPRGNYDRGGSNDRHPSYNGGPRPGYGGGYGYTGGRGYGGSYGYRGNYGYRGASYGYSPYYYAPRPLAYRYAPPRYYGPGGHLSLSFGFGSGYLYGSAYTGRVYGYRGPAPAYGNYRNYGDIRLQVNPRDAAVYVDGYYAGIVDDFDGSSQRLALEAGPHKVEIAVQGAEPQVFDVYVDPERTVELHADLLRYGR